MADHNFNIDDWCTRCGCGLIHVHNGDAEKDCPATDNVVAITHIVRGRVLDAIIGMKRDAYPCR